MKGNREEQEVLVFPRTHIQDCNGFTPWALLEQALEAAEEDAAWMPRGHAEESEDWVQPIPCAVIIGPDGTYHAFRRIGQGRADLRSRISLIIGGHLERGDESASLARTAKTALRREMAEELGVEPPERLKPTGMVIDHSSVKASRHVGLVHEAIILQPAVPKAGEEFEASSDVAGKQFTAEELERFRQEMDPSSRIILDSCILPTTGGQGQPARSD